MENQNIKIQTQVNSNISKVWEYYNNPEHITKWNFASDDWCCPKAENNLKVGGQIKSRMEAKDKSYGFDFVATYTRIIENKLIEFNIEDGRKVSIKFEEKYNQTDIEIEFQAEQTYPVEMQKNGWQSILNNFKKYVENN